MSQSNLAMLGYCIDNRLMASATVRQQGRVFLQTAFFKRSPKLHHFPELEILHRLCMAQPKPNFSKYKRSSESYEWPSLTAISRRTASSPIRFAW